MLSDVCSDVSYAVSCVVLGTGCYSGVLGCYTGGVGVLYWGCRGVMMGIIIGTCVPDSEPDSAAYGPQLRRPPRRILYGKYYRVHRHSFCLPIKIPKLSIQDEA